jgi:hypothetical protein
VALIPGQFTLSYFNYKFDPEYTLTTGIEITPVPGPDAARRDLQRIPTIVPHVGSRCADGRESR